MPKKKIITLNVPAPEPKEKNNKTDPEPTKSVSQIAVIKTGGKQYLVKEGEEVEIEKLKGIDGEQKEIIFEDLLAGKKVTAIIIGAFRQPKVTSFQYRNKTGYKKTKGHRQPALKIKIAKIQ